METTRNCRSQRQVDGKFSASLSYTIRPCVKKEEEGRKEGEVSRPQDEWLSEVLSVKPDSLSLISGAHLVEGKNQFLRVAL